MGPGAKGKGDGTGAMTDLPDEKLGANQVLSNRDKASRGDQRGQDGKAIQTDQYQDHSANQRSARPGDAGKDRSEQARTKKD